MTELIDTWIRVWTHVRSMDVSEVDDWPLVQVGSATRETELICTDPGPDEFLSLLHHIEGRPRAMLTVIGADLRPYDAMPLPRTVHVDRHDETLMTTIFEPIIAPLPPGDFTARWDVQDNTVTYAVESGERVAAAGSMGVLGAHATFDAVETTPVFQRRGLGRHVMSALTDHAREAGAEHGILAASAQGRVLYESLGWRSAFEMRSLTGVAADL